MKERERDDLRKKVLVYGVSMTTKASEELEDERQQTHHHLTWILFHYLL